jgi:hypothetical protein
LLRSPLVVLGKRLKSIRDGLIGHVPGNAKQRLRGRQIFLAQHGRTPSINLVDPIQIWFLDFSATTKFAFSKPTMPINRDPRQPSRYRANARSVRWSNLAPQNAATG